MAVKIALDAGHGLKTPGKRTPDGIHEWTLNDKVRDKVVDFLEPYDCEIIHTDKDEGKVDEPLADRWKRYMNAGVSAFVSIHHNANTGTWNNATGVETFVDNGAIPQDVILANCIHKRLVKYTGMRDRGIKRKDFYVINQDRIPAVLVEGGFMDGREDYKYITSDAGQTSYAKAVAEGLIEFLNLKKKKEAPKKETVKKEATTKKTESFLPERGYFKKGDVSPNVGKIASFMRKAFPSYTSEKALGNTYGDNLIKAVKEFQKRTGLEPDGYFGKLTLAELEKHGFKK